MRLDKFISLTGNGSRSVIKNEIKKGAAKINNNIVKDPAYKVDENSDIIMWKGKRLEYNKFHYYMFNKPAGVICANSDNKHKTVMEYFKVLNIKGLFSVGRLDKDTHGLLLITDDGLLSHNMLSPKKHVTKKYYVETDNEIDEKIINNFLEGIDIGEKNITKPAKLEILDSNKAYITITEGKYHQIKRMFGYFKLKVTYLKRLEMGELILDSNLDEGCFRELTKEELEIIERYK